MSTSTITVNTTVNERESNFVKQKALSDKLIEEIRHATAITLIKAFGAAKTELEQQAIIEAAQDLDHLELSITFMEEVELFTRRN